MNGKPIFHLVRTFEGGRQTVTNLPVPLDGVLAILAEETAGELISATVHRVDHLRAADDAPPAPPLEPGTIYGGADPLPAPG